MLVKGPPVETYLVAHEQLGLRAQMNIVECLTKKTSNSMVLRIFAKYLVE